MTLVAPIFAVFTEIGNWIFEMLAKIPEIFVKLNTDGVAELTILGVLALCGLGIGLVILLVNIVRSFFRFK